MYPRSNTEGHPLQELEPPVVIEKVIEPLTHEQIATVFDSMNPNTVLGARNTAIYSLMLTPASGYSKSFVRKTFDVHLEDRYCRSIIPIRDKSSSRVLLGRWNRLERLDAQQGALAYCRSGRMPQLDHLPPLRPPVLPRFLHVRLFLTANAASSLRAGPSLDHLSNFLGPRQVSQ